jgi:mannobiose 2-epimerase
MKTTLLTFLTFAFISFTTSDVYSQKVSGNDNQLYLKTMKNLIDFFDENAYDNSKMTYLSEIDNVGKPISDKVFTVALNRCIYGLSYSSQFFPNNLTRAQQSSEFLLNNLIGKDSIGKYFISFIENKIPDNSEDLDIWQQAYGLCGLTELYRVTKDQKLLNEIHELHNAFIQRFRDKKRGGFYGNYNILKRGKFLEVSLFNL